MMSRICATLCILGLLVGPTACGPKDDGRTTTPPPGRADPPPDDPPPRTTPPPKAPRRTPPPAAATGVQCPKPGGVGLQPVRWPASLASQRRYWSETRLDKVQTTKATPVEVCGARGQVAWLLRARCPGGTSAFVDGRTAHRSRAGNVGPGGRCGKIVDLYKVPCGAKVYSIYMSLYHCTAGQRFP